MSKELSNPLLDIVGRALKSKPVGPAAKMNERFTNAGKDVVALCDVSDSMQDFVGSTRKSKRYPQYPQAPGSTAGRQAYPGAYGDPRK
jgi:hypothetical protein